MRKTRRDGPCWPWGGKVKRGYGQDSDRQAHRVIYERVMGVELDPQDHLHHLCIEPLCVNPWHMEVLTRDEHERVHGRHGEQCPAGHGYTPENTYEYVRKDGRRERHCRKCRRDRIRKPGGRVNRSKYNPTASG